VTIRPATPADIPDLLALWNPLIAGSMVTFNPTEKTAEDLAAMIEDKRKGDYPFLVAYDGTLQGFVTYGQFRAGVGYARAMEHTIILGEGARGRGLGRALMAQIEDHARDRGRHSMIAGVSGGNPQGRAFHAALGYDLVATVPQVGWKFGQFWDLWLMQKILTK